MNIFLTNIKKVNANWLTLQYNIDIVSLVEVIEGVMKKINTPTLSDLTTTKGDERNSGLIPVAKDNLIKAKILDEPTTDKGTPVLLGIDAKIAYRHIDRQFKGGFYACTNQQCNNVIQYIPS